MYAVVIPNHIIAHTRWQKTRLEYDADEWYMNRPFPGSPSGATTVGGRGEGVGETLLGGENATPGRRTAMKVGGCLLQALLFLVPLPVVFVLFALPSAESTFLAFLFWTWYFDRKESDRD